MNIKKILILLCLINIAFFTTTNLFAKAEDCPEGLGWKKVREQKLTCKWEWYHKNGELGQVVYYENGEPKGEWKNYDDNGNITYLSYINDKDDEKYSKWYKTNVVPKNIKNCPTSLSEKEIKANKLTCFYDKYFHLHIKSQLHFGLYLKGKQHGEWHHKGKGYKDITIINYKNGIKEGNFIVANNGNIESTGIYKNNLKEGVWIDYYTNWGREKSGKFKIRQIGKYKNNLKEGEWKAYDHGSILSEYYKKYYLISIKNYKNGKKEGEWKEYYENKNLESVINYRNNIKHGKFATYLKDGTLDEKGKYENGKKILDLSIYQ